MAGAGGPLGSVAGADPAPDPITGVAAISHRCIARLVGRMGEGDSHGPTGASRVARYAGNRRVRGRRSEEVRGQSAAGLDRAAEHVLGDGLAAVRSQDPDIFAGGGPSV